MHKLKLIRLQITLIIITSTLGCSTQPLNMPDDKSFALAPEQQSAAVEKQRQIENNIAARRCIQESERTIKVKIQSSGPSQDGFVRGNATISNEILVPAGVDSDKYGQCMSQNGQEQPALKLDSPANRKIIMKHGVLTAE